MKITGAAPKIAIPTFVYMLISIFIDDRAKPLFNITQEHSSTLDIVAVILIIIGITFVAIVGRKLTKSFSAGLLMSDGLYRIVRNPMYASYTLFIIPGLCLLFNSWLVLTTVIVNFILFQIFIREEYRYLEDKFGDEYKSYLNNVWIKFL